MREQTEHYLDQHGWDVAEDEDSWREYQKQRMAKEYQTSVNQRNARKLNAPTWGTEEGWCACSGRFFPENVTLGDHAGDLRMSHWMGDLSSA